MLERRYQEQIRSLQDEFQKERDSLGSQASQLRKELSTVQMVSQNNQSKLEDIISSLKLVRSSSFNFPLIFYLSINFYIFLQPSFLLLFLPLLIHVHQLFFVVATSIQEGQLESPFEKTRSGADKCINMRWEKRFEQSFFIFFSGEHHSHHQHQVTLASSHVRASRIK